MTSAPRWRDDGVKTMSSKMEIVRFTQRSPIRNFTDSSRFQNYFFTKRS